MAGRLRNGGVGYPAGECQLKYHRLMARTMRQPSLPQISYSPRELIEEVRARSFPALREPVELFFGKIGSLAFIRRPLSNQNATIFIHDIINRPDTPMPVLRFVVLHELLHLQIPPREIGRKRTTHPPEFWTVERQLAPDREECWAWIWLSFHSHLVHDEKKEQTRVKRTWVKTLGVALTEWETACQIVANDSQYRGIHEI